MVACKLAVPPHSFLDLSLGIDEFAFAFSFAVLEHAHVVVAYQVEHPTIPIKLMIMKLAFLYFCVAEDHTANTLQRVGSSLELPNQKVVDLAMRFELQFLIKEIYRLVGVPNNLLDG